MSAAVEPPIVRVLPGRAYESTRAVIEAIGEVMIAAGAVTAAYVDGMLRKETAAPTVVTSDVALPHGTADVRSAVLRNVLVVAPIPAGLDWAPDRPVHLAIGFAGNGDEAHLRLMATVARVLSDEARVARLKRGGDALALAALFA